jgi:hypothetical protein
MADNQGRDKKAAPRRRSSTSPLDGRTDKATKPPGQGDIDRKAVEKGWAALDLAAGGH